MKAAAYFQNDMVLQREKPITIYGSCSNNEKIQLKIFQKEVLVFEKQAFFSDSFLFVCPAFQDYTEKIFIELTSAEEKLSFSAYLGDVFLLAGQSNMAYSFYVTDDYPSYVDNCKESLPIRYLDLGDTEVEVEKIERPLQPLDEINQESIWFGNDKPNRRDGFSAIGVYFGHAYYQKHHVPVGLINVSVGGCSIDSFLPMEYIYCSKDIKNYLESKGKIKGNEVSQISYTQTSGIYNQKVSPLKNVSFKAVFWYQGEHHVGSQEDGDFYYQSLVTLICSYRDIFNDQKLDFGCIQIANNYYPQDNGYGIPIINEAIQKAVLSTRDSFVVPIYDFLLKWKNDRIGDNAMLIHPTNKYEVAMRLFDLYENPDILPIISNYVIEDSKIILTIDHACSRLKTSDGMPIQGFTIADKTGRYYKASATFLGKDKIVLENKHIQHPCDFMYGFYLYNKDANVCNEKEIPLLPYRSNKNHNDSNQLCAYHPLFDLYHENILELGFLPIIANPKSNKRFVNGTINVTGEMDISITDNSELLCHYKVKTKGVNYFGVSPNLDLSGTKLRISSNELCEVEYTTTSTDLIFAGILVKTNDNHTVQFPVIKLTKESTSVNAIIGFDKANNADLTIRKIDQHFLQSIKQFQFIFETQKDVDIMINHIEFYRGNYNE
ncbi:sialate O-acetylesterase [Candidatus Izemoplasma sp. B36]|uniref:sialate O-acetylesterase n=1 Tax=Candidatus Izemoplasma sp. B36 TaxID=3242468 RepID=UPI003555CAD9